MMDAYQRAVGGFLFYPDYIAMLNSAENAHEASQQYLRPLLISISLGLILFLVTLIPVKKNIFIAQKWIITLPIIAIFSLTYLLFLREGEGGKALPPMFTLLAYNNLYLYEQFTADTSPRIDVQITSKTQNPTKDIIYIVDESIRGDFLDINSSHGVFSNLNHHSNAWQVTNFGLASSVTTCSYDVNITLRYGGTRKNYAQIINKYPSIWAYAQNAGYKTIYIDAQRTNQNLQNGMTKEEKTKIDRHIQFDDTEVLQRDIKTAKLISKLSQNNIAEFIFINKMGAHFPVHDKFPDSHITYKPILERGGFLDISDTGDRSSIEQNTDTNKWVKYRNSYRNTLLWNVGEFFSILEKEADFSKMTLIYTSDHGQNLNFEEEDALTHCAGLNSTIESAVIPIVIIEGKDSKVLNFKKNLKENFNKTSHFNIFPTILLLMQYDKEETIKLYGTPLNEITNDPQTYNIRFNARLGKKPLWKKLEIEKLINPNR
jgi:glucan phosphoethanolaminetransferase (alkaline phosphatase superfamily)